MRSVVRGVIVLGSLVVGTVVVGCATSIPSKLKVRDVTSGRTYMTYEPWGKVTKGVGYEFTDIESGNRITLTNYELSTVEGEKSVPPNSTEADTFKSDKARGGIK
jgi:hypothetical protein